MDKYTILSPESKGSFNDRLNFLYLKLGNYLDTEKIENRTLLYCKVFLSDSQNQMKDLEASLLYQEFLASTHFTIVEQAPLNGSKVSLLVKTSSDDTPLLFHSIRLTEEEAKGKTSYEQTRMLFDKYLLVLKNENETRNSKENAPENPNTVADYKTSETMTMERNLVRTWIYVTDIDVNYEGVVEARNDVFDQQGLTADTHYIASTGIGGATPVRHAAVGIDFLTIPNIQEEDKKYLQALDHLNPTHEYGVAFERGARLSLPGKQVYYISGTASIDKHGAVMYEGDIVRQTGRLLENIGALLKDGDATMNNIQYFIIYLRDISDYHTVEKMMQQFYPQIPHIIVEARVCRPGWLIEMECIAEKTI